MPTLPVQNVVVNPSCANNTIEFDHPADIVGEDIVGGGSYSGGIKVVSVVLGRMYRFDKGANDTSLDNGAVNYTADTDFQATGLTVTLNGAGAVTATIKPMNVQTYRVYRDRNILLEFPSIELPGHIPIGDPNRTELTFYTYRVDAIDTAGSIASSPLAAVLTPECTPTGYPMQFGSAVGEASLASATDASDNVIVTGQLLSGLSRLMYLAKFNSSAALSWAKYFPHQLPANPQQSPGITGCVTDASGNIFISGQFSGRLDLGDGWIDGTNGDRNEVFIAKFNSSGTLQFKTVRANPGMRGDYNSRIALNGGNIFLLCQTQQQFTGILTVIEKYNSSGVLQWTRTLPTSPSVGDLRAADIAVNAAGDIFITGQTLGGFNIGCDTEISFGTWIAIAKLSGTDGSCLWSACYGKTELPTFGIEGLLIALDSEEDVIVAGTYVLYGNTAGGDIFIEGDNGGSPFLAKYSGTDGSHIWSVPLATTSRPSSRATALKVGASDAIFLGGRIGAGRVIFNGQTILTPASSQGFVAKYSAAGAGVSLNITSFEESVIDFGLLSSNRMAVVGFADAPARLTDLYIDVFAQ